MASREEFVAAYAEMTGITEDWAGEIYDALLCSDSPDVLVAIERVCESVPRRTVGQERGDGE